MSTVTSINPTTGNAAGGDSATIIGTGFLNATTGATGDVTFISGGVQATSPGFVVDDATIQLVTPPWSGATPLAVDIRVVQKDGNFAALVAAFTYTPIPPPPLTITSPLPPQATINRAYSWSMTAANGSPPYSWAVTSGTLPPGLSLAASTGVISGTPTTAGNYPYTITVTDSLSATAGADQTITVRAAAGVDSFTPHSGPGFESRNITIMGWNLMGATSVTFNGFPGSNMVVAASSDPTDDTIITVDSPVLGFGDAIVLVWVGSVSYLVGTYNYFRPPPPDPEPPGPGGVPMHQGRCLALAQIDDDLVLSNILDLMDYDTNGIIVDNVDLGFPDVREDVGVWPDADGDWDFTRFFGSRGITLGGTLVDSARGTRSMSLKALVPFLQLTNRPVLLYCFDADDDVVYIQIRAAGYSGAITNPIITKWSAQWKCPDGRAYSMVQKTITIVPVDFGALGRIYAEPQPDPGPPGTVTIALPMSTQSGFLHDRHYPGSRGVNLGNALNEGTAPSWPIFQIFGQCTGPYFENETTGQTFGMLSNYVVNSGEVLTIDTRARAVYLGPNPDSTRYNYVDFSRSSWWPLQPGDNEIRFDPASAGNDAQMTVTWQDAYI